MCAATVGGPGVEPLARTLFFPDHKGAGTGGKISLVPSLGTVLDASRKSGSLVALRAEDYSAFGEPPRLARIGLVTPDLPDSAEQERTRTNEPEQPSH